MKKRKRKSLPSDRKAGSHQLGREKEHIECSTATSRHHRHPSFRLGGAKKGPLRGGAPRFSDGAAHGRFALTSIGRVTDRQVPYST